MKKIFKNIFLIIRTFLLKTLFFFLSAREQMINCDQIKRILVIRLDRIGDLCLSTGFLKYVRNKFPQAHITLLITSRTKDLLKGSPLVDEIVIYSKKQDHKNRYDLVFDCISDYKLKTALFTYKTRAKYRIGFDVYGKGVFYSMPVKSSEKNRHVVDHVFDLARAIDPQAVEQRPELTLEDSAASVIEHLLEEHQIKPNDLVVCIHPGGFYSTQRWDVANFANVADAIREKYHATIIAVASEGEWPLINEMQKNMREPMIAFVGQPLNQCVALIQRAQLFIGNNSGMLHIASVLDVPTISTMGPTNASRWWPIGEKNIVLRKDIPCIGCESGICRIKQLDCMKMITVEDMLGAVKEQLSI